MAAPARACGRTEHGGLLFLVGLVEELGLPALLATAGLFPDRPWRWVWFRFALALLSLPENDPAALAFAGLAPSEPPPEVGEEPMTEGELAVLRSWRQQVVAALAERLQRPATEPDLLDRVCRRQALVVADPGWIEVHLLLAEVDTDVRARLRQKRMRDLDQHARTVSGLRVGADSAAMGQILND